ncbi:DUF302 domain-containing protein [Hoeflea sp. WL0058]|uniref:DUF302 domain-containing protein n=1 Tax=Flavimaribacter sediminis TaxID=2865987 RepID=A0AAE2ZT18_9HYPH|nr:DUF302 domain-containing protein [Flavimaribacter sediminis]MBW8640018.1 DUF302 domain-containing protein [Flavimaribacter sediminis]
MRRLSSNIFALVLVLGFAGSALASSIADREGWVIRETPYSFADLNSRLDQAIKGAKMGLVTQASASKGAESRGVTIAGNRVVGVYRNDFAVRMLDASLAAGIEAPIRFYVTEDEGGSTLSYKTPTFVFSPYFDEGGETLKSLAAELDGIFAGIADQAAGK